MTKLPWIAKVYIYPFERWPSLGRQALFGAPHFTFFLLYQKFWPCPAKGEFVADIKGEKKTIEFDSRNTQFQAVYSKAFAAGYEPHLAALIDVLTKPDGVFYDIGSNWGFFSLRVASRPDFKGKVHAFEPFPSSYTDLSSTVNQAGVTEVVKCHNVALTDRTGQSFMHLPDGFQSGMASMGEQTSSGSKAVQTTSLDALGIDPPTVMKVDVEGHEIKVFRGGAALLAKHRPMIVFENSRAAANPSQTLDPLFFLKDLGYVFFQLTWLRQDQGRTFFIGDDADPSPQAEETLALVPFRPEERFFSHDGMNILACHTDRLNELKAIFEERILENAAKS